MGEVDIDTDELLINQKFDELLGACKDICKKEEDWELIKKAFFIANEAHKGVRRKSGEPYILHPIAVAKVCVDEIGLGVKSVASALLHDVVEDTDYTVADIEHLFGAKIASMVDGLTKMAGVFSADSSQQAENFKKVILTLSDDFRVILIKIADRLHNMRTLGSMPIHKQMKIAGETVYLFAPLAYRLGLHSIKSELEDLSLKYRYPTDYRTIQAKLAETEFMRLQFIDKFNCPIIAKLKENNIDFEIVSRVKSVYSIWKKMQIKQIQFEEIYDLFAIRIIFKPSPLIPEKSQCWHIYSLITDIYKPKPDRIRDWVNIPKANGYEALHCTVMGPDGTWAEVQIRSERMDEVAERGFAAHWFYKDDDMISVARPDADKWLKQLREALASPTDDAVEFLDNFKLNLFVSEIIVFTPRGDARTLPKGATVLDLAYDIHSKIGNTAIGAKINYQLATIFTEIHSGDQVEVLTSNNASPRPEWLDHVVTVKAKQHIKNFLKKDNENNLRQGQEIFENKLAEYGIKPQGRVFQKVLPAYGCASKDDFYSKLGMGILKLDGLEKILRQNTATKMVKYWTLQFSKLLGNDDKKRKESSEGHSDIKYSIAGCCAPIPGDDVIGFKDDDKGEVVVHKKNCSTAIKLAAQHGDKIVPAKWLSEKQMSYLTEIEIFGIDRVGFLQDLFHVISGELNVNIRQLNIHSHDGIFEGHLTIYVKDKRDLKRIIDQVSKVKGLEKIKRVEHVID